MDFAGLREKFSSRAAHIAGTAALVLGLPFLIATTANAQTLAENKAKTELPYDPDKVPIMDARGANRNLVYLGAAQLSADSIVLVFFGTDEKLFELTKQVVSDGIDKGYPIRGIVVASAEPDEGSWVDGIADGMKSNNRGIKTIGELKLLIKKTYSDLLYQREWEKQHGSEAQKSQNIPGKELE